MAHNEIKIKQKLKSGICEVTIVNEHSVEDKISATLSTNHLPDGEDSFNDVDMMDMDNNQNTFKVFNVAEEEWQMISINSIIDIEQLTGIGSPSNENKLQASEEYLLEIIEE